jgi:high affinity sulfate transporter 1
MKHSSRRNIERVVYLQEEEHSGGLQRSQTLDDIPIPTYIPQQKAYFDPSLLFPFLSLLKEYNRYTFLHDIRSALTVAFVLIPQAIAFSSLAGVDPIRALVSAIFPLLCYAIFGASRQLSVGPEALSSVLVGLVVAHEHKITGQDPNEIATLLGFIVGLFCIFMAIIRAGFIDNILSGFLLTGFVLGVANLIMVEQLPAMFGLVFEREEGSSTYQLLITTLQAFPNLNVNASILGCSCLAFLLLFGFLKKRFHNGYLTQIPEILTLVVVCTILSVVLDFKNHGIPLLGHFNNELPIPKIPTLSFDAISRLLPSVVLITIVGFIESQTVTRNFGLKNGYFPSGDREFFALGVSNVFGSFFGAYVTFGSLPRSRIQFNSGGKTTFAGFMAGITVLILTTTLGSVLQYLPKPTMAAIVMNAAINLIEYDEIGFLLKMRNFSELFLFLFIWCMTFFISINQGIILCLAFSGLLILRKTTLLHLGLVGKLEYTHQNEPKIAYVDVQDYPEATLTQGILAISIHNHLEFYNAGRLRRRIEMLLELEAAALDAQQQHHKRSFNELQNQRQSTLFVQSNIKLEELGLTIVLDFAKCKSIDSNASFILYKIFKSMKKSHVTLFLSGVRPELRIILAKAGILDLVSKEFVVDSVKEVIFKNHQEFV